MHEKTHDPNREVFECDICGRRLSREDHLATHKREMHKEVREKHPCPICGKEYQWKYDIEDHHKICAGGEKKTFKCEICGMAMSRNNVLQQHILRVHGDGTEKKFECDVCGRRYLLASELRTHHKVHLRYEFDCESCEKTFKGPCSPEKHQEAHSQGITDWICSICGGWFTGSSGLAGHKRKVHPASKK